MPVNLGPRCLELWEACEAEGIFLHSFIYPGQSESAGEFLSCDMFPESKFESLLMAH